MKHRISFSDRRQTEKRRELERNQTGGTAGAQGRERMEGGRPQLKIKKMGNYWVPKLTQEIVEKFRRGQNASTTWNDHIIDWSRTKDPKKMVWFNVHGIDIRTKQRANFGLFCLDLEKMEISKIRE